MDKPILIKFGKYLQKLRLERQLSQEDLAFKASLHRTYIGTIERGEQNVSLINIERLARALKLPIKALFDF